MRIVALLISLINFAISVVFFCFPIAYVAKWIWRGLLQKDNRNANMVPPNYGTLMQYAYIILRN